MLSTAYPPEHAGPSDLDKLGAACARGDDRSHVHASRSTNGVRNSSSMLSEAPMVR